MIQEAPTTAEQVALGNPSFVWRAGQDRRLNLIRRYVDLENAVVLDIGCGIGTYVTEANQENRNLLLSHRAKADSDPVLEILTSEVIKCAHAATVGPVDQEALFYLQSRGLNRRQGLQLLVAGFLQSVAGDIPIEGVAEEISELVHAKLAQAEIVE